jgi:2-oxoisovalerate dehydrogenase E1 component alpha subunit
MLSRRIPKLFKSFAQPVRQFAAMD